VTGVDSTKRRKVSERHLKRIRRICAALPETTEKLSHGEPTFFVRKKVYAMFSNNHHNDGHVAVLVPAPPGIQAMLIKASLLAAYAGVVLLAGGVRGREVGLLLRRPRIVPTGTAVEVP